VPSCAGPLVLPERFCKYYCRIGLVAVRGGDVQEIRPGDVVYIEPTEEHWHGATPDRFMAHAPMQEADENGQVVTWLDHVTDNEYRS
jgi:hypothetical protein